VSTIPLTTSERRDARDHAMAVGQHVRELGHPGPVDLVTADLLLLAERVVRLVDQIDPTEEGPYRSELKAWAKAIGKEDQLG
jgi:hypothetical protein